MNLRIIAKITLFVGILVQVLWGFIGHAWGVSWIATFVAVMLMCILNVIASGIEKDKKDKKDDKSDKQ